MAPNAAPGPSSRYARLAAGRAGVRAPPDLFGDFCQGRDRGTGLQKGKKARFDTDLTKGLHMGVEIGWLAAVPYLGPKMQALWDPYLSGSGAAHPLDRDRQRTTAPAERMWQDRSLRMSVSRDHGAAARGRCYRLSAAQRAWARWELRTNGPEATPRKPRASAFSRYCSNSSGGT
jgi:hypothetical protein